MKSLKRFLVLATGIVLLAALTFNTVGCAARVQAADMMKGISAEKVAGKSADHKFLETTADFSMELFKNTISPDQNSLVSPLSVLLALAMTANGADGETLAEMETLLGGDIPLDELNKYLYAFAQGLPNTEKSKLTIANSIWFRDSENFQVEGDFLQTNANYYDAAAYKSAFDQQTLKDINNWVKNNTDGMIDKILEEIPSSAIMYLINAITFDAQWETVYKKEDVRPGNFTGLEGKTKEVTMMQSEEKFYLQDDRTTGFVKPYADDCYSFVALLPNPGVCVQEYIESLNGEKLLQLLGNAENTTVRATMPKFSYSYTVEMNDALITLGMPKAFSPGEADFSRLGQVPGENIYIGDVLHKTFISVDAQGTKAAAVTKVGVECTGILDAKHVVLDRPFVYAIIDNASNLPVFIGTVMEINE